MNEPNYPHIIQRLKETLKEREQKARKNASKYNFSKLKQAVTMLEYWEAEYKKTGGEAGQHERRTSTQESNEPATGTERIG